MTAPTREEVPALPSGLPLKIGDECPTCAPSSHAGVWSRRKARWLVCPTCNDQGILDARGLEILYGSGLPRGAVR